MHHPSPDLFFKTVKMYQQTAALKAALELGVFTAIGNGCVTASAIAVQCDTSTRGMRMLCDALVVFEFLVKAEDSYGLTAESAMFLHAQSPDYLGGVTDYLLSPMMAEAFAHLTTAVRKGGTALKNDGFLASDHEAWLRYAQAMTPVIQLPARLMAEQIDVRADRPLKVLDIAAGHGLFGIAFAQRNVHTHVTVLDWPNVLSVAKENARKLGVWDRFSVVEGSALTVDFGANYDVVILANLLHHFDRETCVQVLRKVYGCLAPGGCALILEFVPHADRVTPPEDAAFVLVVLATTPGGDVYPFKELEAMCCDAGFNCCSLHPLGQGEQSVVMAKK